MLSVCLAALWASNRHPYVHIPHGQNVITRQVNSLQHPRDPWDEAATPPADGIIATSDWPACILDSSRARGNNTRRSLSPKPISKERKDKGKGKGKKRKCSLSPEEACEPDEYDLAYTSYIPGKGTGSHSMRVMYTDKKGVERIKYTALEQLSTHEEKDQYIRKHGHPYSVQVGFDFNPYVKELAKDDFQRIARPKGELGCNFLPHVIAGLKTDYDSYMNYLGDLRKCIIKYEPLNADISEGKITWSHYGGLVRHKIYSYMEGKYPFLKCFHDKTGENNWLVRDTAQQYLLQARTYNNSRNCKGRDWYIKRNQSGKATKPEEEEDDEEEQSNDDDTPRGAKKGKQEKAKANAKNLVNAKAPKAKAPEKAKALVKSKMSEKGKVSSKQPPTSRCQVESDLDSDSSSDSELEELTLEPELTAMHKPKKACKASHQVVEVVLSSPTKGKSQSPKKVVDTPATPPARAPKRKRHVPHNDKQEEEPVPKKAKRSSRLNPTPKPQSEPDSEPKQLVSQRKHPIMHPKPIPESKPEPEPEPEPEPKPEQPFVQRKCPNLKPTPAPEPGPESESEQPVVQKKPTHMKPTTIPSEPELTGNSSAANLQSQIGSSVPRTSRAEVKSHPQYTPEGHHIKSVTKMIIQVPREGLCSAKKL
ncbi:hypothetical protein OPQ81_011027 [Rhizoctonia solani]|nr:hypothetical protein OPQ81_011027 [Rhizoctonia solani]